MAATYQRRAANLSAYRDQQFQGSLQEQEARLRTSTTLYVGNLSFFTTEDQIYHLFAKSGDVKRVVIGLDRFNRTPCGFCFVEYYTRSDAEDAIRYVSGTRLDERIIRCDWDAGFVEGRQYGRGKSGGQVRDEFRNDYDAGRGGFGKLIQHRVDKFGPVGMDGPPDRRFERGKRKRTDEEGSQEEEEEDQADRTTDLRQKLQKIREDRAKNGDHNPETAGETDENGNPNPGMEENSDPLKTPENGTENSSMAPQDTFTKSDQLPVVDSDDFGEGKRDSDAEMRDIVAGTDAGAVSEEMETDGTES